MLGMKFMTGALVGAGLVYLLDPKYGAARRTRLRRLWEQNQGPVMDRVNDAGEAARRAGREAADRVQQRAGSASS